MACAWRNPGGQWVDDPGGVPTGPSALGIDVTAADGKLTKILVSGDPSCLQAVSSAGGRVQVNADTARRIVTLMQTGK